MAGCTSLTVTAPAPTVTLSNIGFGNSAGRFTTCTRPASEIGSVIYLYADYVTTNNPSSIEGSSSFKNPAGTSIVTGWALMSPGSSGTISINTEELYAQGSYSALVITGTATA